LREELSRGPLRPGDVAVYVFLASGVSMPLFYSEAINDDLGELAASLGAVLGQIVISAYGVWRCYHANGGSSGQYFAETFIALAWVVGVRVFLVALIPFGALLILAQDLPSAITEVLVLGFTVIYFWRIWVHIGWVRQHRESAA
jgi:hypothetical protein